MKNSILICSILLSLAILSFAAEESSPQGRVMITADSTSMETNGTFVLNGNVKLTSMDAFGSGVNKITNVSVRCDKAIVHQDPETHDIGKIEGLGRVIIRTSQGTVTGSKLIYDAKKDTFRMTGQPVMKDLRGNTASGSAITWDNKARKLALEEGSRITLNMQDGKLRLPNIKESK